MSAEALQATSQRWPKGVSGNPAGSRAKVLERAQLEADIVAELGPNNLTASDRLELRQAIELLTRRPHKHADAVRCSNAGSRMIQKVRARVQQRIDNAPVPSFQELTGNAV
jgi:hypothetical protein